MKDTFYQKKTLYGSIKAIKRGRNILIVAVFIAFGLLSTKTPILGASIFNDNFDSYSAGDLAGQGDWTCDYSFWNVNSANYFSSPNSIVDEASSFVSSCHKTGASSTIGSFSFEIKTTNCGSGSSRNEEFDFRFSGSPYIQQPFIRISKDNDTGLCRVENEAITDIRQVPLNTFNDWTKFSVSWKLEIDNYYYFKWRYGTTTETDWIKGISIMNGGIFPTGFDRIYIYGTYDSGGEKFYLDNIEAATPLCSSFNDWNSCSLAGCYWNCFSLFVGQNPPQQCQCETGSAGICGNGYDSCQYCNSTSTCAAQSNCFWYDLANVCRYGKTACAGTSLGLCTNQTDCENAGGFWYGNYCWLSPKPSYLISWSDWYALHGNYATPTAFVDDIASSTQGFFDSIGGFFGGFAQSFNLNEAYSKGSILGGVIPVARGYISAFDSYLAGFPVGEIFLFFLIIMLAVIIFRLTTRLITLIKFW